MFLAEEKGVALGEFWLEKAGELKGASFLQAMVLYQQGKALKDRRRIQQARAQMEQLLKQQPDSLSILNNLAWMMAVDLQRPDLALPYVEEILRLTSGRPMSPGLVDTVAEVLHAAGRTRQAWRLVQQAQLASPQDGVLRYHSGVMQLATGGATIAATAVQDLKMARTRARLSPSREAVVAALQQRFPTAP